MLFLKTVISILALPGIVVGAIPTLLISNDPWRWSGHWLGYIPTMLGLAILAMSIGAFYVAGKGTLAPWAPPKSVVRVGLYRFVRSPMYVGVLLCLLGLAISYGSPLVGCYFIFIGVIFHLNLVYIEEPRLAKQFGEKWKQYAAAVPRWLPRV